MISFTSSGSFNRTDSFLQAMLKPSLPGILQQYGREGVQALAAATPRDSGATAASWGFEVKSGRGSSSITWTNSHDAGGTPLVIMLQFGHGTGTGGYVAGRDFINGAIRPIFDRISDEVWKAVTSA